MLCFKAQTDTWTDRPYKMHYLRENDQQSEVNKSIANVIIHVQEVNKYAC